MLLPLLLLSCQPPPTAEPAVIVLVLDGVRAEESLGEHVSSATGLEPWESLPEVWDTLVPLGTRATAALNLGITITAPAHCAMLSGRRQPFANYPAEPAPGAYRPALPSLFEALGTEASTVMVGNTALIESLSHSLAPDAAVGAEFVFVSDASASDSPARSDQTVLEAVLAVLETRHPRLVVANLHAADRAGHYGDADDYPQKVQAMDAPLAAFWDALQAMPDYRDRTHLLIVSDHGRHRQSGGDPPWREHGDDCMGCRLLPLLLLGPHATPGATVSQPVLLSDLAPTLGALLGVAVPWAEGLPHPDLLTVLPLPVARSGIADLSVSGGVQAVARYGDTPARRAWVEVDGEILSSPYALTAEGPVLAVEPDGRRRWLCFREIRVDLSATHAPWVPRCFMAEDAGGWQELPPPEARVGPFWQPVLLPDLLGGLQLVYPSNPNGHASFGNKEEGEVGLRGRYLDGAAWSGPVQLEGMTFPDGAAALALADGREVWATAGAPSSEAGRDGRQIYLAVVEAGRLHSRARVDFAALSAGGAWRVEHPALGVDAAEDTLWLAALASDEAGGTAVVVASSPDSGEHWEAETRIPAPGAVLPHLTPRWTAAGELVFGTLAGEQAAVCRWAPGASVVDCQEVGGPRLLEIEVDGAMVWGVVDVGVGQWEARVIPPLQ